MKSVLNMYKEVGETPLQCIERFRKKNPEYANVKMTYAGRLDPMAEGVLLVLSGSAVHQKDEYLTLPKVYETEILFGISTDSYDLLGLIADVASPKHIDMGRLAESFIGRRKQIYPPFSSKPYRGKPLFVRAKSGELRDADIPEREIEITDIAFLAQRTVSGNELLGEAVHKIELVTGDFRQGEIAVRWKAFAREYGEAAFPIYRLRVTCSSGTYIRGLFNEMGRSVGLPALAFSIKRTMVGEYEMKKND